MQNNNEVDVNVLIKAYHQKISQITNENILLEAKLQTLIKDFNDLLLSKNELSEKYESLLEKK